jgi:hypothetical protein
MDGVGATYESLRGKPFAALRSHIDYIRQLAPFGINFVVNKSTLPDIDRAVDFAAEVGATEFLLLPEQAVNGVGGIDPATFWTLRIWIKNYHGPLPLAISEVDAGDDPIYVRVTNEKGLQAYAHIDATGTLKRSSYERHGVLIGPKGLIEALRVMKVSRREECK